MSINYSAIGQAAAQAEDMSKEVSFTRELPKEGPAFLRFNKYIELGRHEGKVAGHRPAIKCIVGFELHHPSHLVEFDGKKEPGRIEHRVNKGSTSKSGFKKLFNLMNEHSGGGHQSWFSMFGKGFLGRVYHSKSADGKTTYANLDKDKAWSILPLVQEDMLTGDVKPIVIPETKEDQFQGFLWENAEVPDDQYVAMWEGLFIEGTRNNENNEEVSKNWIQETIMANLEWQGSRLQKLVGGDDDIVLDEHETPADTLAGAAE